MTALAADPIAFWLAIAVGLFCVKHFLADFLLQTNWMAVGKGAKTGWLLPLMAHTALHAVLTGLIFALIAPKLTLIAMFADWVIHSIIDRGKVLLSHYFGADPSNPQYWWLLGGDQLAHQLTHLGLSVVAAIAV